MALIKPIVGEDGVTTTYHRVVRIDSALGDSTLIEVESMVDEASRERQRAMADPMSDPNAPQQYTCPRYYHLGYVDGMTASAAYAYLLTLPEFSGAVSDEGDA